MAKKLIYNYTFDASAQTLVISGNFKLRTIQLITNVTDGIIIYNFADPNKEDLYLIAQQMMKLLSLLSMIPHQ